MSLRSEKLPQQAFLDFPPFSYNMYFLYFSRMEGIVKTHWDRTNVLVRKVGLDRTVNAGTLLMPTTLAVPIHVKIEALANPIRTIKATNAFVPLVSG